MRPSHTGTQHARTSVLVLAAVWLLLGAAVLPACGSDDDGDADTASSDTSTPTTTSGPSTELMAQLAADGDDATFEDRYGGEIAAGPSDETVMVYAGRSGTDALLYVCDGVDGAWYGGQVEADGSGTLGSTDGQATVTLAAEGEGLAAEFDGGTFDGLTTTLTALEDGIGALLRVEAPVGTETATGGIIIGPTGLRGVVNVGVTPVGSGSTSTTRRASTTTTAPAGTGSIPTTLVSRTRTGLLTFRILVPPPSGSTTTTTRAPTTTTTRPSTTSAPQSGGGSPGGVGDGGGGDVALPQTGGEQVVTQCGALVATIEALVDEIQAQTDTLDASRQQRDALVGQLAGKTDAQRNTIEQQIANLDALIASIEAQITAIQELIDDLGDELDICDTTRPPK